MAEPRRSIKSTNVRTKLKTAALRWGFNGLGAVVPDAAAAAWGALFLATRRRPTPEREARWLRSAARGAIESDCGPLSFHAWGSGPTVLLIHGWNGRGSQLGAFATAVAQRGFRAVALDLPGHGASPGRSSSLLAMAAGIEAAIRQLGAPAGIIAHSAGCAATTLALQDAGCEPALAFVAPPEDLGYFALELARNVGISPRVHRRARRRIEARFGIPWSQLRLPALAPEMTQPLVVIHDAGDREVPLSHGRKVATSWPGASLVTTRGLGHQRILRDAEVVDQAVRFVTETRGPRVMAV